MITQFPAHITPELTSKGCLGLPSPAEAKAIVEAPVNFRTFNPQQFAEAWQIFRGLPVPVSYDLMDNIGSLDRNRYKMEVSRGLYFFYTPLPVSDTPPPPPPADPITETKETTPQPIPFGDPINNVGPTDLYNPDPNIGDARPIDNLGPADIVPFGDPINNIGPKEVYTPIEPIYNPGDTANRLKKELGKTVFARQGSAPSNTDLILVENGYYFYTLREFVPTPPKEDPVQITSEDLGGINQLVNNAGGFTSGLPNQLPGTPGEFSESVTPAASQTVKSTSVVADLNAQAAAQNAKTNTGANKDNLKPLIAIGIAGTIVLVGTILNKRKKAS